MNPKFKTFARINNFFFQTLDHQINQQIIDETSVHCKHSAHVMQTYVKEFWNFLILWLNVLAKEKNKTTSKKKSLLSNKAHAAVLKLQTLHYVSQTRLLFFGLFSVCKFQDFFQEFKTLYKPCENQEQELSHQCTAPYIP